MMDLILHRPHRCSRQTWKRGFTLVELLVVIMIIGLLSGIVLSSMDGNDDVQSLNAGVSKASGLFSLARSTAITRKTRVRLLVSNDKTSTDATERRYRRYMTVVYEDPLNSNTWKLFTEGETLPQGVFFYVKKSSGHTSAPMQVENFDIIDSNVTGPINWFYYEFSPNGTVASPNVNASFVIARGLLDTSTAALKVPRDELIAGFKLFKAGRVMFYQQQHLGTL